MPSLGRGALTLYSNRTTTQLTTSFAEHVAGFFGLGEGEKVVEYGVRGVSFRFI